MAVDVYSEKLIGIISPRISFSKDLEEDDEITNPIMDDFPCRLDQSLMDSAFDFAFNVDTGIKFQSSTADELFSNGKLIASGIKNEEEIQTITKEEQNPVSICLIPQKPSPANIETRKKSLKEFLEDSIEEEEDEEQTMAEEKSFWMFRRSSSLNSDRNQNKKGLIGSWKILSRSGSTGKFLEKIVEEEKPNSRFFRNFSRSNSLISENVNRDANSKILEKIMEEEKSNSNFFRKFSRINSLNSENVNGDAKGLIGTSNLLRRSHSTSDQHHFESNWKQFRRSNSTGSANQNSVKQIRTKSSEKGQVKNFKGYGYGNYNNNNVRISPVLNLPSPYISRVSVDLFGFGSLFCNGTKDRKKKK